MLESKPFGLLLITGNQTHQENYARAFAADNRCRLIGLTDEPHVDERRRRLNRQLADELRIPCFDDLDAALARDDVHLVSICAEPERRGDLTIQAARAGKHVYLDKEPAVTRDGLRRLLDAIESAGVLSQSFSLVRHFAAAQARRAIESGRLGKLVGLHCELFFAKGISGTADLSSPRQEQRKAERFTFLDSKRELLCVGYYPLVLFQWLTGARYSAVDATTSNYFFSAHQRNDVEDYSCLMLGMDNGVEATVSVGRVGWMSHPSHGIHQLHLVGTERTLSIDAFQPRLEIYADAPAWKQPTVPHPEDPMGFWSSTQKEGGVEPKNDWFSVQPAAKSDAACFLDCIELDSPSDVSAAVAAHAVDVVLAAYESAASHKTVAISGSAV